MFRTIEWLDASNEVRLVDQTKLPLKTEHIVTDSHERMAKAIKIMEIRGAPAIGAAAGMGMALAAIESKAGSKDDLISFLEKAAVTLNTRPTAVNLTWATARMLKVAKSADGSANEIVQILVDEAKENARTEAQRIVTAANAEIEQEVNRAREELRSQVASLAVAGASRVLKREIDAAANEDLLKDLVAEL